MEQARLIQQQEDDHEADGEEDDDEDDEEEEEEEEYGDEDCAGRRGSPEPRTQGFSEDAVRKRMVAQREDEEEDT